MYAKKNLLDIRPVHSCGAEKKAGTFMVEPTIHLYVAGEGRVEGLVLRRNPIQDWGFQPFGVIGSSTGCTFL